MDIELSGNLLVDDAEKPFVLFGQGVILGKAEEEFKQFIEKSGLPAAWTILGLVLYRYAISVSSASQGCITDK